ncbi:MAG: hypothetical protein OHK0015_51650 [Chloroflexi bacterium OHK40]
MATDTPVSELVPQLSRVGLRPDARLVERIVAHGADGRRALLTLATSVAALHDELPAALGPLHALRLLGELPDVEIIGPLLAVLPVPIRHREDVPPRLYGTEVLQIIGRIGAPAVPVLWAHADDPATSEMARSAAISALSYVATRAPELREEVLAEARRRLEHETDMARTTGLVTVLAELGDAESYRAVMAAYRAGRVDQRQAPAATARQFLLGGGRRDLNCVNHPLFERYDHHGPHLRPTEDPDLD